MFGVNNLSISGMLAKLRAYRNTSTKPAPQKTPDQVAKEKQAIEDRRSFLKGAASWGTAGFLTLYTPLPMVNKVFADEAKTSTKKKEAVDPKAIESILKDLTTKLKTHKHNVDKPQYLFDEILLLSKLIDFDTSKLPKKLKSQMAKEIQRHVKFILKVAKKKHAAYMKLPAKDRPRMSLEHMRFWEIATSLTKAEQKEFGIRETVLEGIALVMQTFKFGDLKDSASIAWNMLGLINAKETAHKGAIKKMKEMGLEKNKQAQDFIAESKRWVNILKTSLNALELAYGLNQKQDGTAALKAKTKFDNELKIAKANLKNGINHHLKLSKYERLTLKQIDGFLKAKGVTPKLSKLNSRKD